MLYLSLFGQQINNRKRSDLVEFCTVCPSFRTRFAHIIGCLHSQTDSEIGTLFYSGIFDNLDHPLNSPVAETTRDQNIIPPIPFNWSLKPSVSIFSESTNFTLTLQSLGMPPWMSASLRLL